MARHGFRVFTFSCKANGRGQFVDVSTEDVRSHIAAVMDNLGLRDGWPNRAVSERSDADRADPVIPSMTVLWADWINERHLHVRATFGEHGLHDRLARRGKTSLDIRNAAAEVTHRLDFIFPTEGTEGLCVMETVDNKDHIRFLKQWFVAASREMRDSLNKEHRERRRSQKAEKAQVDELRTYVALTLQFGRLADPEQLRRVIEMAKKTEVEFIQHQESDRSGEGVVKKRRLRVRLTDDLEFERAIDFVDGWWRTLNEDDVPRVPMAEAVLKAEEAFGVDDDEDYDEVRIEVTPQHGSARSFTPLYMREIFTYPLSVGRTSMVHYYEGVTAKVQQLALANGMALTIGSSEEVRECLEGLIQDHSEEESALASESADEPETSPETGEPEASS